MGMGLLDNAIEKLKIEIDSALDHKNRELFMKYSENYNDMCSLNIILNQFVRIDESVQSLISQIKIRF